jgi:hypothetical protein
MGNINLFTFVSGDIMTIFTLQTLIGCGRCDFTIKKVVLDTCGPRQVEPRVTFGTMVFCGTEFEASYNVIGKTVVVLFEVIIEANITLVCICNGSLTVLDGVLHTVGVCQVEPWLTGKTFILSSGGGGTIQGCFGVTSGVTGLEVETIVTFHTCVGVGQVSVAVDDILGFTLSLVITGVHSILTDITEETRSVEIGEVFISVTVTHMIPTGQVIRSGQELVPAFLTNILGNGPCFAVFNMLGHHSVHTFIVGYIQVMGPGAFQTYTGSDFIFLTVVHHGSVQTFIGSKEVFNVTFHTSGFIRVLLTVGNHIIRVLLTISVCV